MRTEIKLPGIVNCPIKDIVYIEGKGNYSLVYLATKKEVYIAKTLKSLNPISECTNSFEFINPIWSIKKISLLVIPQVSTKLLHHWAILCQFHGEN